MENYGDTAASARDMQDRASETASAAAAALNSAKQTARSAVDASRNYATNAVNSAGEKLGDLKGHVDRVSGQAAQVIAEKPLHYIGIAVAAGLIVGLLLNGSRRTRY
jgi:ElaB/YqjD/DUF883 family membrane-anchored ribosome-binding protein